MSDKVKVKYDRVCEFYGSENIESVSYSFESNILLVRFTTTAEYRYYDVPIGVWSDVVSAQSVGRAFNKFVSRRDFRYEKVDD
jgi:hypothetical protein